MVDIVGREKELRKLTRFYESPKSEFMAVYGRRRVGKTFLIQTFFSQTDAVFFHVTGLKHSNLSDQIANFTRVLGKTFYESAEIRLKKNWLEVFEQLTEAIAKVPKKKKVVIFFDELPWMATKRSKLIQALDHFWNRYWSIDPRIKLVVCGSSASWILEKLIHNKGGLYNRITYQIALTPFTLLESKQFLRHKNIHLNNDQILKLYMVMGGIPLYLDQVDPGLSADQNIDEICFTKQGLLFSEFKRLFSSLFEHHEVNEELVRLIAMRRYGISQMEIMKKSSKSVGGRLKKRLQELVDAGFIELFVPYGHKERGIYYRIIDEYTLFYLKWIEPVLNSIKHQDKEQGYWLSKHKRAVWFSWAGYAFESICYKHIELIKKKLNIGPDAEVGAWRHTPKYFEEEGVQIDLLFDREDGAITLCEIKYVIDGFAIDKEYAGKLKKKIQIYRDQTKTQKQIFLAIITSNGLITNQYSNELVAKQVSLKDLV